jgi:hypothetical protein
MTYEELGREIRVLATPIDFAELEARGIITKVGAWFRVSNLHDLPEHAAKKITNMEFYKNGGVKVKFAKASRFEKLAKRFEQINAQKESKNPIKRR